MNYFSVKKQNGYYPLLLSSGIHKLIVDIFELMIVYQCPFCSDIAIDDLRKVKIKFHSLTRYSAVGMLFIVI